MAVYSRYLHQWDLQDLETLRALSIAPSLQYVRYNAPGHSDPASLSVSIPNLYVPAISYNTAS